MMDRIDVQLQRMDQVATAPQVLPQLLRALREENTEISRIVDLIALDPGLTAKVLRACNSAYFARSEKINDVTEAVTLLGFHVVYQMVAAASASAALKISRPEFGVDSGALWRHSVTTAFAAQFVAEEKGLDAGLLFTSGLLHDVGKVVMAETYKSDYGLHMETGARHGEPLCDREQKRFEVDHARAGARLMDHWKFSNEMILSVKFHHHPAAAGGEYLSAACLQLGDALAHTIDQDFQKETPAQNEPPEALDLLNLTPEDLPRFQEMVRENLQFVEALCRV